MNKKRKIYFFDYSEVNSTSNILRAVLNKKIGHNSILLSKFNHILVDGELIAVRFIFWLFFLQAKFDDSKITLTPFFVGSASNNLALLGCIRVKYSIKKDIIKEVRHDD